VLTPLEPPLPDPHGLIELIYEAAEIDRKEWAAVKHGRRRQSPLYAFARELRRCPEIGDADDKPALAMVCAALQQTGTTLDALFPYSPDPAIHFLQGWKNSSQVGMFELAVYEADREPEAIAHTASMKYTRFLRICKHLQLNKDDDSIIVAVRPFAATLGVTPQMVSLYIRQGMDDGLLVPVEPANHRQHRAARYKYLKKLA
jgi:hypothetical protein